MNPDELRDDELPQGEGTSHETSAIPLLAPISAGDLIDRSTILDIKSCRIRDSGKLANVRRERGLLLRIIEDSIPSSQALTTLTNSLRGVNEKLWDIERDIRECESRNEFGKPFIELARSVYKVNDERAELKRKINLLLGSLVVEEKDY